MLWFLKIEHGTFTWQDDRFPWTFISLQERPRGTRLVKWMPSACGIWYNVHLGILFLSSISKKPSATDGWIGANRFLRGPESSPPLFVDRAQEKCENYTEKSLITASFYTLLFYCHSAAQLHGPSARRGVKSWKTLEDIPLHPPYHRTTTFFSTKTCLKKTKIRPRKAAKRLKF